MTSAAARDAIVPVDDEAGRAARRRIDDLTKPVESLGRIEDLAVRLSAIAGRAIVRPYERAAVLIGAGDHGVTAEGVSAYPAEVTLQMVGAFCGGFAAINAFARTARADVFVADFGVRGELPTHPHLIDVRVGAGTRNFARGDAMDETDVELCLAAGIAAVDDVFARAPYDVLALGEMGIGNTTSAATIVSVLTGASAKAVTGRGTGIDDERLGVKRRVVREAAEKLAGADWKRVAAAVGGFEIVGLAGAILGAAARRIPIVLDGFIVASAALLAQRICPASIGYCIAAHRSQEPGHRIALDTLGLVPLFDFDLRLGEASGAALALPLVESATRMISEMKTFAEAGVSEADPS
jgi:nicotinate-nucleotide--dimethylbenzimidazole phosphoribosyltransferase